MSDSQPILLYVGAAAAVAYYLYTKPPTPERTDFMRPGTNYNTYDPQLVISNYDYRNNRFAKDAFWHNQYIRKDNKISAPPE